MYIEPEKFGAKEKIALFLIILFILFSLKK
jgi:hypothetical protein